MLNEHDLNRIKGLLHFLNGSPSATRDVGQRQEGGDGGAIRRVSPAVAANMPKPSVKFVVDVFNNHGDKVGSIKRVAEGTREDYAFFVGS